MMILPLTGKGGAPTSSQEMQYRRIPDEKMWEFPDPSHGKVFRGGVEKSSQLMLRCMWPLEIFSLAGGPNFSKASFLAFPTLTSW